MGSLCVCLARITAGNKQLSRPSLGYGAREASEKKKEISGAGGLQSFSPLPPSSLTRMGGGGEGGGRH